MIYVIEWKPFRSSKWWPLHMHLKECHAKAALKKMQTDNLGHGKGAYRVTPYFSYVRWREEKAARKGASK